MERAPSPLVHFHTTRAGQHEGIYLSHLQETAEVELERARHRVVESERLFRGSEAEDFEHVLEGRMVGVPLRGGHEVHGRPVGKLHPGVVNDRRPFAPPGRRQARRGCPRYHDTALIFGVFCLCQQCAFSADM